MKIVFAGTPVFAEKHLSALLKQSKQASSELEVIAAYTQPDRPAGRGKKLSASPVKTLALEHGVRVYQPQNFKHEDDIQTLAGLKPDLMVVVAYGLLLPKVVLDIPRLGCINVHGSILPRWRGAAPIQRAIEAGDKQSGVTIMQMDVGLDTGAMLKKIFCDIGADDSASDLHDKLANIGPTALIDTIQELAEHAASPEIQDNALSTYATKISKQEALINWGDSAELVARKVRAFNPFPVCYSFLNGERIKIYAARVLTANNSNQTREFGHLRVENGHLIASCARGELEILTLQTPGKKVVDAKSYLNGLNHTLPATRFSNA